MLRILSTTSLTLALTFGALQAEAQNLRNSDGPAEFPPSSFTGKQYVDSKGCVFVRAGFDGNVTWVPRVNRQRKVLCGQSPTFASKPAPEPRQPVQVATTPAAPVPTPPKPTPTARVVTPKPAPTRTVAAAPVPTQPVRVLPRPTNVQPTSAPIRSVPPRQVAVVPTQPVRTVTGGCPGASAISQQYLNSSRNVRCGPQGEHPSGYATGTTGTTGSTVAPSAVVRVAPAPAIAPPAGYKPAFEEDRFNPNRGKQTREGFVQMRLIWTAGTPRRLVDQSTGRDVTGLFPGLRFPFISMKQQAAYVANNGWPEGSGVSRNVTVSTKNTTPTAVVPRTTTGTRNGHRYVQIGTFGNPNNAKATAGRLQALGLPVRLGTYQKAGKTYRVVLAGPFNNGSALQSALSTARSAGFSDAFTRK